MKLIKTTLAMLGTLGFGALTLNGSASADNTKKPPSIVAPIKAPTLSAALKRCDEVAASKTQALGANQPGIMATSPATYGTPGCDSFVVDTTVTSASLASNHTPEVHFQYEPFFQGAGAGGQAQTQAACEATVVSFNFYRKLHGQTAFTKVGGGTAKGKWNPNAGGFTQTCPLEKQAGFQDPPKFALPNAAGKTDTYRIAISFKQGTAKKVVKGGLAHQYIVQ